MLTIRTQDRKSLVKFNSDIYISDYVRNSETEDREIDLLKKSFPGCINSETNKRFKSFAELETYISKKYPKTTYVIYMSNSRELGKYSGLERALTVLDEIQKASVGDQYIDYEKAVANSVPCVYEMPKE